MNMRKRVNQSIYMKLRNENAHKLLEEEKNVNHVVRKSESKKIKLKLHISNKANRENVS